MTKSGFNSGYTQGAVSNLCSGDYEARSWDVRESIMMWRHCPMREVTPFPLQTARWLFWPNFINLLCSSADCSPPENNVIRSTGFHLNASYNVSEQCIWIVYNPNLADSSIAVRFLTLDLESHGECRFDFVELREGQYCFFFLSFFNWMRSYMWICFGAGGREKLNKSSFWGSYMCFFPLWSSWICCTICLTKMISENVMLKGVVQTREIQYGGSNCLSETCRRSTIISCFLDWPLFVEPCILDLLSVFSLPWIHRSTASATRPVNLVVTMFVRKRRFPSRFGNTGNAFERC